MRFEFIILLATSLIAGVFADVGQVHADIQQIIAKVTILVKAVDNIPPNGGTLQNGQDIRNKVGETKAALDKCTGDTKATPRFSEADSRAIFLSIKDRLAVEVVHLLANLIIKEPSVIKIPFPGVKALVRQAVESLQRSADAFEGALIEKSTAEIQPQAKELKARIDVAFGRAIDAYS